jgi:hypothetical protein
MNKISKNSENKQTCETAVNISVFENVLIGKKDSNGIELKNGDNITIEVCKPNGANKRGVYHKGQIVYENCSFSIKMKRVGEIFDINPLSNYASFCIITLNN